MASTTLFGPRHMIAYFLVFSLKPFPFFSIESVSSHCSACVGEVRRLVIPAYLAFGEQGRPGKVPANAAVVYEVLLHIP